MPIRLLVYHKDSTHSRYRNVVLVFVRMSCDFQELLPLEMLYICVHTVEHTISQYTAQTHTHGLVIKVVNWDRDDTVQSGQTVTVL